MVTFALKLEWKFKCFLPLSIWIYWRSLEGPSKLGQKSMVKRSDSENLVRRPNSEQATQAGSRTSDHLFWQFCWLSVLGPLVRTFHWSLMILQLSDGSGWLYLCCGDISKTLAFLWLWLLLCNTAMILFHKLFSLALIPNWRRVRVPRSFLTLSWWSEPPPSPGGMSTKTWKRTKKGSHSTSVENQVWSLAQFLDQFAFCTIDLLGIDDPSLGRTLFSFVPTSKSLI